MCWPLRVSAVGETHRLQHGLGLRPGLAAGAAEQPAEKARLGELHGQHDVAQGGQVGEDRVLLEDHAPVGPRFVGHGLAVGELDTDEVGVRGALAQQAVIEGELADALHGLRGLLAGDEGHRDGRRVEELSGGQLRLVARQVGAGGIAHVGAGPLTHFVLADVPLGHVHRLQRPGQQVVGDGELHQVHTLAGDVGEPVGVLEHHAVVAGGEVADDQRRGVHPAPVHH